MAFLPIGETSTNTISLKIEPPGTVTEAAKLNGRYSFLVVYCEETPDIVGGTTIKAEVKYDDHQPAWIPLFELNAPDVLWEKELPGTAFGFAMTNAFGARQIRFVLDTAPNKSLTLRVLGVSRTG